MFTNSSQNTYCILSKYNLKETNNCNQYNCNGYLCYAGCGKSGNGVIVYRPSICLTVYMFSYCSSCIFFHPYAQFKSIAKYLLLKSVY